jgi:1-acyl-sn-glycerol-3-phosphate acyltransferase
MLYRLLKIIMTTGLRFFYRHIHFAGAENIPRRGPAIIIANHPSSLMDAALLGILLRRPVYFFARGDVFINGPVTRILSWLHMMPVHNHQAGRHTLGANQDSFSTGQKILNKGGIIVFFPESNSHVEHQLLPFRKGVFRLAFLTAAEAGFRYEIPVIPAGISYDHPRAARRELTVKIGEPILLSSYRSLYAENPAGCLLQISKDAYTRMMDLVLHIEDPDRLFTADLALEMDRSSRKIPLLPWIQKNTTKLDREQAICRRINGWDSGKFSLIRERSVGYSGKLEALGIPDRSVARPRMPAFGDRALLLVFLLPAALGWLANALPVLIARRVADKKVYRQDFYSWIFVACYSLLYLFWIILLAEFSFLLPYPWRAWLLGVPLAGLLAYYYVDGWHCWRRARNWQRLGTEGQKALQEERSALEKLMQA